MTNTLGNINISSYFKMPRQKPTINNVIEGFLIRKPTASDATDEDMKWGKVEILWIDNSGRVKRRFINYLSKFHKKLMRAGAIGTENTPFIRSKGGYLIRRVKPVSLIVSDTNVNTLKNTLVGFRLNQNQYNIKVDTHLIGVIKTLELIIEIFAGDNVILKVEDAFYTLNDNNINTLIDRIKELILAPDIMTAINDIGGSDREFLVNLNFFEEMEIFKPDYVALDVNGNPLNNPEGSFFKYHHNFKKLNLDKYGIFKNDIDDGAYVKQLDTNCLLRALKEGGLNEIKLARMRCCVKNRSIPMCLIKKICEMMKIHILVKRNDNNHSHYEYGKDYKDIESYTIGLVDGHYFIVDDVGITKYALKNIFKLEKRKDKWQHIIDAKFNKKKGRTIDSYNLVKFLIENKETHLVKIQMNLSILKTQFYDMIEDDEILEYDEDECTELNEWDDKKQDWISKNMTKPIVWFDFETDPNAKKHLPFLCCSEDEDGNRRTFLNDYARNDLYVKGELKYKKGQCLYNCGKKFLESLTGEKVLLIAHNAGYDYRFLVKYLFCIKQITKGSGLMNAQASYINKAGDIIDLEVKDSYKLITMPLRSFGKCFKIPQGKEVMPYTLYNQNNIKNKFVMIAAARIHLNSDEDYEQMKKNIDKWNIKYVIDGIDYFDIIKYSEEYCRIDVSVLKEGYLIFRDWLLEAYGIDINFVWTIASLAHKVLLKTGCYDDVYQLAGVPRMFIQKCVVGGRTMVRDNKKNCITAGKIADYDGVSLYPSASTRIGKELGGFLRGTPQVLKHLRYDWLQKNTDGYFIKIKITKVNKPRHFSLISVVNENKVRIFRNDVEGEFFYVDRITLEDWIEFMGIEYEIIKGYYYDEGRNDRITETMQSMFNERLKKKAEGNGIQIVYKLILNASYGRSILKPIKTDEKIISGSKSKDNYVQKNYNKIQEFTKLDGCDMWAFKIIKPINEHFNNAPVGVEILAMSKRIMNEVMCLADDNDLKIYYQDTDSMHIDYDDVKVLELAFEKKYNRVLTGKQLGQFHIDFDLKGSCTDIVAVESIFLGKKCYIDELVSKDKDGKKITGYHCRMKGIPHSTLNYTAQKRNQTLLEMYQDLYAGVPITFDLLNGGQRCNFKFNKDMSIASMKDFKRTLKF